LAAALASSQPVIGCIDPGDAVTARAADLDLKTECGGWRGRAASNALAAAVLDELLSIITAARETGEFDDDARRRFVVCAAGCLGSDGASVLWLMGMHPAKAAVVA
jgi:hypothetical protein